MASEWQGGPNFGLIRRGSSMSRHGGTNDGQGRKKYGDAGTKRFRFNPNPTRCNSPSCVIMAQSKRDAAAYDFKNRPVKYIQSGF